MSDLVPYVAPVPVKYSPSTLMVLANEALKSGWYKKFGNPSAALMVLMFGQDLGMSPSTSLTSVNFIEGKPCISGNLMWSLVMRDPEYKDSRVTQHTDKAVEIKWVRNGQLLGISKWTIEDAIRAGLEKKDVWKKYPRAMLFNRAISEGFKLYAAHLGLGYTIYTPDELGGEIDESGASPINKPTTATYKGNYEQLQDLLKDTKVTNEDVAKFLDLTVADLGDLTDDELKRCKQMIDARKDLS